MDSWHTMEDMDYDLFTISEFTDGQRYEPPTLKTKPTFNTSKEEKVIPKRPVFKSLYDFEDFSELDEGEKQKIARKQHVQSAGRGYVMKKYHQVNKGNNVMSQRVLDQTERDIREVCPMGYSNEIIEEVYKNAKNEVTTNESIQREKFKFIPSSDVSKGAIPKKLSENASSYDLPNGFIEYNVDSNLKLSDNNEFPKL